jgi:hypothetical protein
MQVDQEQQISTANTDLEDFLLDLEQVFLNLDSSQDSISQASSFLSRQQRGLEPETQAAHAVNLWCGYFLRCPKQKKVAFMYLANDLIVKCFLKKQKGKPVAVDYHPDFSLCIEQVLKILFGLYEPKPLLKDVYLPILKVI